MFYLFKKFVHYFNTVHTVQYYKIYNSYYITTQRVNSVFIFNLHSKMTENISVQGRTFNNSPLKVVKETYSFELMLRYLL